MFEPLGDGWWERIAKQTPDWCDDEMMRRLEITSGQASLIAAVFVHGRGGRVKLSMPNLRAACADVAGFAWVQWFTKDAELTAAIRRLVDLDILRVTRKPGRANVYELAASPPVTDLEPGTAERLDAEIDAVAAIARLVRIAGRSETIAVLKAAVNATPERKKKKP